MHTVNIDLVVLNLNKRFLDTAFTHTMERLCTPYQTNSPIPASCIFIKAPMVCFLLLLAINFTLLFHFVSIYPVLCFIPHLAVFIFHGRNTKVDGLLQNGRSLLPAPVLADLIYKSFLSSTEQFVMEFIEKIVIVAQLMDMHQPLHCILVALLETWLVTPEMTPSNSSPMNCSILDFHLITPAPGLTHLSALKGRHFNRYLEESFRNETPVFPSIFRSGILDNAVYLKISNCPIGLNLSDDLSKCPEFCGISFGLLHGAGSGG